MSDTTPAIAGIQKCGCVTYINSDPDNLDRIDQKAIGRIVVEGGQILRATVGEIKALPDFLPRECPHDPSGWNREESKPPNRIVYRRTFRGPTRVDVRVPRWPNGFGAGEVRKRDGKWWATEGWFNVGDGASGGDEQHAPREILGPFSSRRAAAEALIPSAERRAVALSAEIDASRQKAAARGPDG